MAFSFCPVPNFSFTVLQNIRSIFSFSKGFPTTNTSLFSSKRKVCNMGLEGSWGLVRWKTPVVSMCNSDVRDVQNEGEAVQAGFFLYVLFQMKNEQCGIARVFLGSPFVIVGGEYVANQPVGRLPLRGERDDLRGVSGDYMLYSLLHVVD